MWPKTTARFYSEGLANVQETVREEEMRFEPPTKCGQRLSRRHILRQVVPDLWTDNRKISATST